MLKPVKKAIRWVLRKFGFELLRCGPEFPPDFGPDELEIIRAAQPFCMTSPERTYALCKATEYIVRHNIVGDIVECGVWRGGSMMAVALTLVRLGDQTRHFYLYDTFEGMPPPSNHDVTFRGQSAKEMLGKEDLNKSEAYQAGVWAYASLEEARTNLHSTGYDQAKFHFIKGKVQDTIPDQAPSTISLLRMDTDWYDSTRHEMTHLFPRISPGGVIIVDDYGHWGGVKEAVDEYLQDTQSRLLLNRIDYAARIGVVSGEGTGCPQNES